MKIEMNYKIGFFVMFVFVFLLLYINLSMFEELSNGKVCNDALIGLKNGKACCEIKNPKKCYFTYPILNFEIGDIIKLNSTR